MINIQENISLKYFTTFQIGGRARYFLIAKNEDDLREAFSFVKSRKLPLFVLGGGSNVLFSDQDFSGLIIKNEIKGIKFIDLPVQAGQGMDKVILEIGAGEIWDDIVALSVIRNLFGLENLSGIPGTVGGAVVQNAGAYGGELKDCLVSVAGFNSVNGKKFNFEKADCDYGYRSSFFKKNKKFIITSVTLILSKKLGANFDYASLKEQLTEEEKITPQKIREIVLKVRGEKLPDWHKIGTAGSFFKNPVISKYDYSKLVEKFPDLPGFSEPKDKIKIPLAWILDKICQLKGFKEGRVGLYEKQPLVVVNLGGATEKEISDFTEKIKNIVVKKTSIKIECEVEKI